MPETKDLDAILQTIRDVEESLDKRLTRALGVNLMIWGLASGSIFLFYQLVEWNHAPYEAALGPALQWAWLAPIAIGYVASALVGVRMGRSVETHGARRQWRKALLPGIIATVAAAGLILAGRAELVTGVLLALLGVFFLFMADRTSATGRVCLVLGAANVAAGIALLVLRPEWTSLAGAVVMGGGLLAMGTWVFASAR